MDKNDNKKNIINKIIKKIIEIGAIAFVAFLVGSFLLRSGLVHMKWYDNYLDKKIEKRNTAIAEAKDIFDLFPFMVSTGSYDSGCWYSDVKDYKKFLKVFQFMGEYGGYTIFTYEGERYLAVVYTEENYNGGFGRIRNVKREYSGNNLRINFDIEHKTYSDRTADDRRAKILIKLEENIDHLYINGTRYREFEGQVIKVDGKEGYLDKNLNVKLPVIYDDMQLRWIYKKGELQEHLYIIKGPEGVGLLDRNADFIFQPKYKNVEVLDNRLYLVEEEDESSGDIIIKIYNKYKDVLNSQNIGDGYVDEIIYINDQVNYKIKCKRNGVWYTGLLGENLEVSIEPCYEDIQVVYTVPDSGYYEIVNNSDMHGKSIN